MWLFSILDFGLKRPKKPKFCILDKTKHNLKYYFIFYYSKYLLFCILHFTRNYTGPQTMDEHFPMSSSTSSFLNLSGLWTVDL